VIVATSEEFTDFAYIPLVIGELALEAPAHNRQYPESSFDTLDSDVESREDNDHDF